MCLVASLRPKMVLMENVPQLLQGIFADDLAEFESNGPALVKAFEASLRILLSLPFGGSLKVQRESQKLPTSFVLGWGTSGASASRQLATPSIGRICRRTSWACRSCASACLWSPSQGSRCHLQRSAWQRCQHGWTACVPVGQGETWLTSCLHLTTQICYRNCVSRSLQWRPPQLYSFCTEARPTRAAECSRGTQRPIGTLGYRLEVIAYRF